MAARRNTLYQYEPLIAPAKWKDDEKRLVQRMAQIADDLYMKISALERRMSEMEERKDASV